MSGRRLLVPVSDSITLRNTVAYAVRSAAEADGESLVHFVSPVSQRHDSAQDALETASESLLERVSVWAADDLDGDDSVTVTTELVGGDRYLFSPSDYVDVFRTCAASRDLETVVLDPEFDPTGVTVLLPSLRAELQRFGLIVEEAPVERPTRRSRIIRRAGFGQFLLLATVSFGFYLLVAGSVAVFDLVTGGLSAVIVAAVLWQVSMTGPVELGQLLRRSIRMGLFAPYLLWEIAKANLHIAYVVLHPSLPIDPQIVEFDAAVWTELSVTTLANSITLTPGTLTVDVNREQFVVHALTGSSRSALLDGGLERAVRFVFYGRAASEIPSPRERGATEDGEES